MCISSIWHLYPRSPSIPKTALIIAASGLLGIIAGAVYAFVRRAFFAGAEDPDRVERRFNLPIFDAIAFSAEQARLLSAKTPVAMALQNATVLPASRRATQPLLSTTHPFDTSIEGLRGLTRV